MNLTLILVLITTIILARVVSYLNKNIRITIDSKEDNLSSKRIINIKYIENLMN